LSTGAGVEGMLLQNLKVTLNVANLNVEFITKGRFRNGKTKQEKQSAPEVLRYKRMG
jgi:hypothetical protein